MHMWFANTAPVCNILPVLDAGYGVHARCVQMLEYTLMIEMAASTFFLDYTALASHAQHFEACWRPSCQARAMQSLECSH